MAENTTENMAEYMTKIRQKKYDGTKYGRNYGGKSKTERVHRKKVQSIVHGLYNEST